MSLGGLLILLCFIAVALLAPALAPSQPFQISPHDTPRSGFWATPRPPSASNSPFGTTQGQYDIFYAVGLGHAHGVPKIGLGVACISVLVGVLVGAIAAYYGGIVDEIMMRVDRRVHGGAVPDRGDQVLTTLMGRGRWLADDRRAQRSADEGVPAAVCVERHPLPRFTMALIPSNPSTFTYLLTRLFCPSKLVALVITFELREPPTLIINMISF